MLYCATTTLTSYVQNKIPLKLFIVIRKWWVLNATIVLMITLQNSRATCSKWRNAVSSGILSFSECFVFLVNRDILRTLSNNVLQCSQCVFVQYLMLQWNTCLHRTEYFLKIILNISICLNYYFLSFLGKITLHSNATVLMFQVQDKLKMFMR